MVLCILVPDPFFAGEICYTWIQADENTFGNLVSISSFLFLFILSASHSTTPIMFSQRTELKAMS